MQVLSNHKSPISLPPVPHPEKKGEHLYPRLKLKPGVNEPDPKHWGACCKAANQAWLGAMFEPGAMRADGKATLEMLGGKAPVATVKRRPVKEMVRLIKSAETVGALGALEKEEGEEKVEGEAKEGAKEEAKEGAEGEKKEGKEEKGKKEEKEKKGKKEKR